MGDVSLARFVHQVSGICSSHEYRARGGVAKVYLDIKHLTTWWLSRTLSSAPLGLSVFVTWWRDETEMEQYPFTLLPLFCKIQIGSFTHPTNYHHSAFYFRWILDEAQHTAPWIYSNTQFILLKNKNIYKTSVFKVYFSNTGIKSVTYIYCCGQPLQLSLTVTHWAKRHLQKWQLYLEHQEG